MNHRPKVFTAYRPVTWTFSLLPRRHAARAIGRSRHRLFSHHSVCRTCGTRAELRRVGHADARRNQLESREPRDGRFFRQREPRFHLVWREIPEVFTKALPRTILNLPYTTIPMRFIRRPRIGSTTRQTGSGRTTISTDRTPATVPRTTTATSRAPTSAGIRAPPAAIWMSAWITSTRTTTTAASRFGSPILTTCTGSTAINRKTTHGSTRK